MKTSFDAYFLDIDGDVKELTFEDKSSAIVHLWNWYMKNHFDPEEAEDDWFSLKLDGFIEGLCSIHPHKVVESTDLNFRLLMIVDPKGAT